MNSIAFITAICFIAVSARPNDIEKDSPEYIGEYGPYFEGDMILRPGQQNGLIDPDARWPNNVVYFNYGSTFNRSWIPVLEQAHADYEVMTDGCLLFVERTDEVGYIDYHSVGEGCYSSVGYTGDPQTINFPEWCINRYGSVLHEILHALGFYHEQSRTDRDDYVTIMEDNIEPDALGNFNTYDEDIITGFGYAYDYLSVMHYSQYAFAINDSIPTIVTKDPDYQDDIGQRIGLSDTDLNKLLAMYECNPDQKVKRQQ